MSAHRRAARPYRGGKRATGTIVRDLSVTPKAEKPVPSPGQPGGPGHFRDIDLAFDPHQPRDPKGRWTRTPGHRAKGAIASFFNPDAPETWPVEKERKIKDPGMDPMTSLPSPGPGEATSHRQGWEAQNTAERWFYDQWYSGEGSSDYDPARVWMAYQNPNDYGEINRGLRQGGEVTVRPSRDPQDEFRASPDVLSADVEKMFKDAGVTTTEPMTVFRALRSNKDFDWAKTLRPGSTFEEKGIVSTTTYRRLAQGWIGLSGTQSAAEDITHLDPDSAVLEIEVPKGARIVGGTTQFIETMLPPGTRFRITEEKRVRTPNAQNPLSGEHLPEFVYTHIKATAILPPEFMEGGPSRG